MIAQQLSDHAAGRDLVLNQLRVVLKMKSWEHVAAPGEASPDRRAFGLGKCHCGTCSEYS